MGRAGEPIDLAAHRERIGQALDCLPADERALWLRIGMALKSGLGEDGFELWDAWSRRAENYREADARAVWRSIDADGGITLGTLFFEASRHGYVRAVPGTSRLTSASRNEGRSPEAQPTGGGAGIPPEQHCNAATLRAYAALKKLPEAFLRSLGLSDIRYRGAPALLIPYRDRFGAEVAVRIRCRLAASLPGDPRFLWRRGDKPQLYGLERLGTPEFVVLVEGESDCHTLWHHGVPALGIPGAGTWNEARDAAHLEHVAKIYVVVEPDRGGEALLKWLARSRIRERAYLLDLAPHKDPSALHCAGPEGFEAAFAAAVARARPFAEILAAQRSRAST